MHSYYEALYGLIIPNAVVSKPIETIPTHCQTVAVMVSYESILCDLCGDKVYGEFFSEPNSSSHGVRGAEQLPVSVAASSSVVVFE